MKNTNKYKSTTNPPSLERIAEAWVRLCLLHITNKYKPVTNHKDKNIYENDTK